MKNLKLKIILSIIAILVITSVVIVCIVEASHFKDVPYYMQHIYGHDLELYKQHRIITISILAAIMAIASGVIIFVDKKDDEEK